MTVLAPSNPFVARNGVRIGPCVVPKHVAKLMHAQLGEAIGDEASIKWMDLHRELDRRFKGGTLVPIRDPRTRLKSVATWIREGSDELLRVAPFAIVKVSRRGGGMICLVRPDPLFGQVAEATVDRVIVRARELKAVRQLK